MKIHEAVARIESWGLLWSEAYEYYLDKEMEDGLARCDGEAASPRNVLARAIREQRARRREAGYFDMMHL